VTTHIALNRDQGLERTWMHVDPQLLRYVNEEKDNLAEVELDRILSKKRDLVLRVLRNKLSQRELSDIDEIANDALLRIAIILRAHRANARQKPIADADSYFAVAAYSAHYRYLRRKYPDWHRAGDRLTRMIEKGRLGRFTTWCDLQRNRWAGIPHITVATPADAVDRARQLLANPYETARGLVPSMDVCDNRQASSVAAALLNWLGSPILWREIVYALGRLWSQQLEVVEVDQNCVSGGQSHDGRILEMEMVREFWEYLSRMQINHRRTYLLTVHMGSESLVSWLVQTGGISIATIANTIDLTPEELRRFRLPLADSEMVARFGSSATVYARWRFRANEKLQTWWNGLRRL
jgi:hypothetical protein